MPKAPNSYIDLAGISVADAQTDDVYLIGGAALNALKSLGKAIQPPKPKSVKVVFDYFNLGQC